jgi:hypothetical protein
MTQFTVAISSCHGWTGGLTGRTIRPPLHSALRQERRPDTGAKTSVETREFQPWVLKDFRKTCATFYDDTSLSHPSKFLAILLEKSPIATMPTAFRWHSRQS